MTRLALLADIHGNLPALQAVLHDLQKFHVDQVVVAGDAISWAPFSADVLEIITRERWPTIRGNHEYYLLDFDTPRAPAHWSEYSLLPWMHRQLNEHWRNVVATWPDTLSLRFVDAPPLRVIHGSPHSPWQPLYAHSSDEELVAFLCDVEEDWLVAGHTHLITDRRIQSKEGKAWHLFNPGSVGVPLDGIQSASYMILDGDADGWTPTFRRVPFDYTALFEEFHRGRFVEECGVTGHLVLREFETARVQVHPFLQWRKACCPDALLSVELLQEFDKVDASKYVLPAYRAR
ncbi:MAG TPA: metallophosphoesterase family protein [Abditibacteriaceae bacterium]|jgi:predicted phosphodiesterase